MKLTIIAGTLAAALLCNGNAIAQVQTEEQQVCINGLNSSMAKFSGFAAKLLSACSASQAKGNVPSAPSCTFGDPKLLEYTTKICVSHDEKCVAVPDFGYTACGYVSGYAPYSTVNVWYGLFDSESGVTPCDSDKDGCKCQQKTLKAGLKVYSAYLKAYNACKKSGLASDTPIIDAAGLADCFGVDPKDAIVKAVGKLGATITKSCKAVAIPFPQGDCTALTGAPLTTCVARVARCHGCRTISASDNLGMDCDFIDDGDTDNGTCD